MKFQLKITEDIESGVGKVPEIYLFNCEASSIPMGLWKIWRWVNKEFYD